MGAARADVRVRIPMADAMTGSLDSLNVNVAAAIVLERVFASNRAAMDATLGDVQQVFEAAAFHHLVVTENGEAVGVLSDRDGRAVEFFEN